jgi:putative glycosyltransferase (TIGR04372 family)
MVPPRILTRGLLKKAVLRISLLLRTLQKAILIAIGTPAAAVLRFTPIRFVNVNVERIGHFIAEPDCYIKEGILGLRPNEIGIICAPLKKVCNSAVLNIWREKVRFVSGTLPCLLLTPLRIHPWLVSDVSRYMVALGKTAGYIAINNQWGNKPPVFALPSELMDQGERLLLELGIPANAWFVCFHSREGGYSPLDEHWHWYRNSSIESFGLAAEEIASRGGWVVRLGDSSMSRMPPWRNAIDYAHSPKRLDWLDIFLIKKCRLFLGNSSGLFYLSTAIGTPTALCNLAPLSSLYQAGGEAHLGIPKLVRNAASGTILTAREILGSSVGDYRFADEFRNAGLEHLDNSPEEIRELVVELLDRDSNEYSYSDEDEMMQETVRRMLRPGHYSYGGKSRIGRDFLRRHAAIMLG